MFCSVTLEAMKNGKSFVCGIAGTGAVHPAAVSQWELLACSIGLEALPLPRLKITSARTSWVHELSCCSFSDTVGKAKMKSTRNQDLRLQREADFGCYGYP